VSQERNLKIIDNVMEVKEAINQACGTSTRPLNTLISLKNIKKNSKRKKLDVLIEFFVLWLDN